VFWLVFSAVYLAVAVVLLRWYLSKLFDDGPRHPDRGDHELDHPCYGDESGIGEHY
jgi:hypothetical protein